MSVEKRQEIKRLGSLIWIKHREEKEQREKTDKTKRGDEREETAQGVRKRILIFNHYYHLLHREVKRGESSRQESLFNFIHHHSS